MYKTLIATGKAFFLLLSLSLFSYTASANVLALDLTKVKYGAGLENRINFLIQNVAMYDHWVHDWKAVIPKDATVKNLTSLYADLEKLNTKNAETYLLMGDVAHYLYNMETEAYFQKAVDNYNAAKALAPTDTRVYWFLGNHYSLSAKMVWGIEQYNIAFKYPRPAAYDVLFWSDYAVACINAGMASSARYASARASKAAGSTTFVEKQIQKVTGNMLKTIPSDTTLAAKDMWYVMGLNGTDRIFTNRVLGLQIAIDTTWKLNVGGLKNGGYIMMIPPQLQAPKGNKIGFSIMVMARPAAPGETLEQQAEKFIGKHEDVKKMSFDVGNLKNCRAYLIKNPKVYPEWGGSRMYGLLIERDMPEYPGVAIELPADPPKQGEVGKVTYFRPLQKYTRLNGKLFYTVMLDSCDDIFKPSDEAFRQFLSKKIIIE